MRGHMARRWTACKKKRRCSSGGRSVRRRCAPRCRRSRWCWPRRAPRRARAAGRIFLEGLSRLADAVQAACDGAHANRAGWKRRARLLWSCGFERLEITSHCDTTDLARTCAEARTEARALAIPKTWLGARKLVRGSLSCGLTASFVKFLTSPSQYSCSSARSPSCHHVMACSPLDVLAGTSFSFKRLSSLYQTPSLRAVERRCQAS